MINFISGTFSVHNTNIKTKEEMTTFIKKIEDAIRNIHPNLEYNDDVEVILEESAGTFE